MTDLDRIAEKVADLVVARLNADRDKRLTGGTEGLAAIIDDTAQERGLTFYDLVSSRRTKELTRARFVAMKRAREAGFTLELIGKVMGGRDHTTIMHGIRRAEELEAAE